MTEPRHPLLPPNSTALEKAASLAIGPWTEGEATIATLQTPAAAPAALLPHVGLGEDLPLWPAAESEQRALLAYSPKLHALIGTAKGLRELARLAGAKVERLETPPAKTFLGAWDAKSRAQWMAAHPEMRLYAQRERAPCEGVMLGSSFVGECPNRTTAMARTAIRAEIRYPDGTTQPLTTHSWADLAQDKTATVAIAQRSTARGLHLGDPLRGTLSTPDAASRSWAVQSVKYRDPRHILLLKQMAPSLQPITPDAEPVAERAIRPHIFCLGMRLAGFTSRSDSATRLYARIRLHDPAVAAKPKHGPAYLGFTRLGGQPFIASADVRMPEHRTPFASSGSAVGACLSPGGAGARMAPVLDAMDWARATHDKVLIRTRLHGTARASRVYRAGAITAGQTTNTR